MVRVLLLAVGVLVVVSLLPVQQARQARSADPAFTAMSLRAGDAGRALLWGDGPIASLVEPFTGAPGNRRQVEYYERGRMEIAGEQGAVTEGALVRELATGVVQQGTDSWVEDTPAAIAILPGDTPSPTYADFAADVTREAVDRALTGDTVVDEWMAPGGETRSAPPPASVTTSRYVSETGHNIASVFASWLDGQPFGALDAAGAVGDPISEPWWVARGDTDTGGDAGAVLVQLFERRVLIYAPRAAGTERVTLAASGRHYYRWRYGDDPQPTPAPADGSLVPADTPDAGLTLPEGYRALALDLDAADVVDLAVGPDGRLTLLRRDGTVASVAPDGGGERTLVEGLSEPAALLWAGSDLYVVDGSGLHRYRDIDGDDTVDDERTLLSARWRPGTVALAVGPNGGIYLAGQALTTTAAGREDVLTTRAVLRIAPDGAGAAETVAVVDAGASVPFIVDDGAHLWLLDSATQLTEITPASQTRDRLLDAASLGATAGVRDLLLYRADGASGTPRDDLLALVADTDGDGGRIVRLQPATPGAENALTRATPDAAARPGAIVDFASGFDTPSAFADGLDGSLYVLDADGVVYRIWPG